jgi:hypothetical protein
MSIKATYIILMLAYEDFNNDDSIINEINMDIAGEFV